MQTLQPTLRLGRDVWDRERMPIEEFRHRAARLRAAMAHLQLDALLLYGHSIDRTGHPTFLTNYSVKLPFAALAVLPRDGEPVLMFQGATRGQSAAAATTWVEDVRPCWRIGETCAAVLAEKGLLGGTIGLAGLPRLMPYDEWPALARALDGSRIVDAEAAVDSVRAIKSPREIATIRRASGIVRGAFERLASARVAAGREALIAAWLTRAARLDGAEDVRVMIARPDEADWTFRPPESRDGTGAPIAILLRASWERYWSEAIRTCIVDDGRCVVASDEEADARYAATVGSFAPGSTVTAAARALAAGGSSAPARALAECGHGHGIGVTAEEWPPLSAGDSTPLERGMCLVVRAALPHGRFGSVLRGDTIAIGESSAALLT